MMTEKFNVQLVRVLRKNRLTERDQFMDDHQPARADPTYRFIHKVMGGRGVTSVSPTAS